MKTKPFCPLVLMFLLAGCASTSPMPGAAGQEAPTSPPPTPTFSSPIISIPTSTAGAPLPTSEARPVQHVIPELRRLTLEFPPKMRAGVEGDTIRLTLEVDDRGNITPTAEIGGHVVEGEVIEIPNLYNTHEVTAEARLDLAGMEVQPSGSIYEPLKRGKPVHFYWSVRPREPGLYRGTVWLHLNFRQRQTGEESRLALSAQIIEIEAVNFLGLPVQTIRMAGAVGTVVSGVLGFPFLDDILKWLWSKRKSPRRKIYDKNHPKN